MTEPDAAPAAIAVQRTEFGVDLGGANSIDGLRALWRGLLKYRSNKALAELRPIIVVKERSNGLGMQLRLVAGPIADAAAAEADGSAPPFYRPNLPVPPDLRHLYLPPPPPDDAT